MAVSKRTFKRRRATRSKRVVAMPVKRYVKSQFNRRLEHKQLNTFADEATVTRAGTIYDLCGVQRGTGGYARIGDEVTFRHIHFRYEVFQRDSLLLNLDNHNNIRVMLVQWKPEYEKDAPIPQRILELDSSIDNDPTIAPYNYDRRRDYTILYDRLHILTGEPIYNGTTVTFYAGPSSYKAAKTSIYSTKVSNKTITYGPVVTSETGKNHIVVLAISDSATIPSPSISFSAVFNYTDA